MTAADAPDPAAPDPAGDPPGETTPARRLRLRRGGGGLPVDQAGLGRERGEERAGVQPRLTSLGPEALEPFPETLEDGTQLAVALGAGTLPGRPETVAHRRGRLRRWYTSVAVDDRWTLGASIVHRGFVGSARAWLHDGERTWAWQHTGLSLRTSSKGPRVRRTPGERAFFADDDVRVAITSGGELDLRLDLDADDGSRRRVRARLLVLPGTPASLSTTTRLEGWNTTTKSAGHEVTGELSVREVDDDGVAGPEPSTRAFRGLGFTDWTAGRQDRRTEWSQAVAVGTTDDGRRVGVHASSGMNHDAGPGEDVLWVDGEPYELVVDEGWGRADTDDEADHADGPWLLSGEGWQLELGTTGDLHRHADRLWTSIDTTTVLGTWRGSVPLPDGSLRRVELAGYAQAGRAKW